MTALDLTRLRKELADVETEIVYKEALIKSCKRRIQELQLKRMNINVQMENLS